MPSKLLAEYALCVCVPTGGTAGPSQSAAATRSVVALNAVCMHRRVLMWALARQALSRGSQCVRMFVCVCVCVCVCVRVKQNVVTLVVVCVPTGGTVEPRSAAACVCVNRNVVTTCGCVCVPTGGAAEPPSAAARLRIERHSRASPALAAAQPSGGCEGGGCALRAV